MGGDEPAENIAGFQESFSACVEYGEAGIGALMRCGCWFCNSCADWFVLRRLRHRRTERTIMAATRAPPPMPAPTPTFAAVERPAFDAVEEVALPLG